jgi:NADPH-dependent glutamate synthase beta subunit-like oxidoreductase
MLSRIFKAAKIKSKNVSLTLNAAYTNSTTDPKVCIVGSGPAGFYTAQHLIKVLKK